MSSTFRREIAPSQFRDALTLLAEHDVPISPAVTAATEALDAVELLRPRNVTAQDVTAAYRDAKATAAQLVTLASEVATIGTRSEAWRGAQIRAAIAGLSTIAEEAAEIVEVLRPTAESHLGIITWFAQEGSPDVSALVREHRTDDAQKAATAPLAYADWQALVKMRRDLSGKHFDWSKAGAWSNPEHVLEAMQNKKQLTGLDYIAAAIRAGGLLWWPSIEAAASVTGRVIDAEDKANAERAAENSRQYHSAL